MKKIAIIMILAAFVASCGNGGSKKKGDGPVMVEMNGTWKGVLPAADCSGIEYKLDLEPQGTYKLKITYIDGEGDGVDSVFDLDGRVVRVSTDSVEYLRLLPPPGDDTIYFMTVSKERLRLVSHLSNLPGAMSPEHYEIVKEK